MIDDFYRDLAGGGAVEGATDGLVEGGPCGLVYVRSEGALQAIVLIAGAGEVGVANEEAFFVGVRVDGPAGDILRLA